MANDRSEELRAALRAAEEAIGRVIVLLDPDEAGDRMPAEDLTEAFRHVAGWRLNLETRRWDGRTVRPRAERSIDDGDASHGLSG